MDECYLLNFRLRQREPFAIDDLMVVVEAPRGDTALSNHVKGGRADPWGIKP